MQLLLTVICSPEHCPWSWHWSTRMVHCNGSTTRGRDLNLDIINLWLSYCTNSSLLQYFLLSSVYYMLSFWQILPSLGSIIIYFSDTPQMPGAVKKLNYKDFLQKLEEIFDKLEEPIVLICGKNNEETGSKEINKSVSLFFEKDKSFCTLKNVPLKI